jgi:hypothetical protein
MTPFILIKVYLAFWMRFMPEEEGNTFLRNVGKLSVYHIPDDSGFLKIK